MQEVGELGDSYPALWPKICAKWYQGAQEHLRVFKTLKKPPKQALMVAEAGYNMKVIHNRIVPETFFGRTCGPWTIMRTNFRWNHSSYHSIFKMCVALTNFDVLWNTMREGDSMRIRRIQNRLNHIVDTTSQKWRESQQQYARERRNVWLLRLETKWSLRKQTHWARFLMWRTDMLTAYLQTILFLYK